MIVEFDLLGTHTGPVPRHPRARAGSSAAACAAFFVFEDGTDRIEIERIYFDAGTILGQLGITSTRRALTSQ